jgi:hypothetical protein
VELAKERKWNACRTREIQLPSEQNGFYAAVHAEVETEDGVFSGLGDASPESVKPNICPHLLRMAETRAKARALRDALGIGMAAFEELRGPEDVMADDLESPQQDTSHTREIDKDPSDVVVSFGKHKGKTLGQILVDKEGASYILWLAENAQIAAVKKAAQMLKGKADTMMHQK